MILDGKNQGRNRNVPMGFQDRDRRYVKLLTIY